MIRNDCKYCEVRKKVTHEDPDSEQAKEELACMHRLAKLEAEKFASGPVKLEEVYDSESTDTIDAVGDFPVGRFTIMRHFIFEILE